MRIKNIYKLPGAIYRGLLSRCVLALLLLFCSVDIFLETVGLPSKVQFYVMQKIGCTACHVARVRIGLVNGLTFSEFSYVQTDGPDDEQGIQVHVPYGRVHLDLWHLLSGNVRIKSIFIQNGSLDWSFPGYDKPLRLNKIQLQSRSMYADTMNVSASAEWNGVQLTFQSDVKNVVSIESFKELIDKLGQDQKFDSKNDFLQKKLDDLLAADFGFNDSFLDIKSEIDVNDLSSARFDGSFTFSDVQVAGIMVPKFHGCFLYENRRIHVSDILWQLGRDESVRGGMTYDFVRGTMQCGIKANVFPSTIVSLCGGEMHLLREYVHLGVPINFSLDMPRCKLTLDEALFSAQCKISDIRIASIDIPSLSFNATYGKGNLDLQDIVLDFRYDDKERVTGKAQINAKERTIAFNLDGSIYLEDKLEALNIKLSSFVKSMIVRDKTALALKLEPSPFDIKQWKLECNIKQPRLDNGEWSIKDINVPLIFHEGKLKIENGSFAFQKGSLPKVRFTAEMDLMKSLSSGLYSLEYGINIGSVKDGQVQACAQLSGTCSYDTKKDESDSKVKCRAFIDRFYETYLKESGYSWNKYVEPFSCGELPYEVEARAIMESDGDWKVDGKIYAAENCGYGLVVARHAESDFSITENALEFTNLHGTLLGGEELSMNIRLQYSPYLFEIKDLHLNGNPALAESFIFSERGKKIYIDIWKNVVWGEKDRPMVNIPLLSYTSDEASINWKMGMEASVEARNFSFYGEKLVHGLVTLKLSLPESLEMPTISLDYGDAQLDGSCTLSFGEDSHCVFSVDRASGALEIRKMILAMSPSLEANFPQLSISDDAFIQCVGSCNLRRPYELEVNGKFNAEHVSLGKYEAESLKSEWTYSQEQLRLNILHANIFGGAFQGACIYDVNFLKGEVIANGNDLCLDDIISTFSKKNEGAEAIPGKVTANCSLRYYLGWGGIPYQIDGMGHVSVSEADIWNVPVLRNLNKVLDATIFKIFSSTDSKVGKITSADATLLFMGKQVLINNLKTDGTLVALEGNGMYSWNEGYIDFMVKSRILKKIGILSMLFTPLTGSFQARLKGPRKEAKWKVQTRMPWLYSDN